MSAPNEADRCRNCGGRVANEGDYLCPACVELAMQRANSRQFQLQAL